MATRGSFFTRGKSSFARTPVPAPAPKPQQMPKAAVAAPAVVAPAATNTYNQTQQDAIRKAQQSMAMLQQPQMPGASTPPNLDALMASFNKSQQASAQNFNQQAAFNQSQQSATQRFNQQAPTMSPQAAQQAEAMGPKMPGMKKGGVVKKKPGYAKGGAVAKKTATSKYAKGGMVAANCGASMKPQQRKK